MIDLKEFKQAFAGSPILIPDYVLEEAFEKVTVLIDRKLLEAKRDDNTQGFIAAYIEAYRGKYGHDPIVGKRSKASGIAARIVREHGSSLAIELMSQFLKMDTKLFVDRGHDLVTFEMNLAAVNRAIPRRRVQPNQPQPKPQLPEPLVEPPMEVVRDIMSSLKSMPRLQEQRKETIDEAKERLRRQAGVTNGR